MPQIDPKTGEVMQAGPQIDPKTGEVVSQPTDTAKMSGNTGMFGGLQDSFDENTKTDPKEPLLETGLKSVAGVIGQPFVHPIGTATGMAKSLRHPLDEAHQEVDALRANPAYEGTKMAGNLFGNVALGAAAGAAPGFVGDVADAIPTRAKAGKLFESVMNDARTQPITMTRSKPILERAMQLSDSGHGTITPLDKLYGRINQTQPLEYAEARDRASALSSLTAGDKMSATGSLQSQAKQLSHAFNQDIGDAASAVGRGDDYASAMSQYSRAARNAKMAGNAAKWGGGVLAGAAGLQGAKTLFDTLRK